MPLFRKRARTEDDAPGSDELAVGSEEEPEAPADSDEPREIARPDGPWDVDDLPEDDNRERIDLGALRVFVPEDVELRVDLDEQRNVAAATLVHDQEILQLGVFAAPRTEPIWDEVRAEIAESINAGGGSAVEHVGPLGTELRARVPTDQPGVFAPARFLGVNGPRWFLRGLQSGPLAAEGQDDDTLMAALRAVVVVRGGDAMAPRDPLPLRLPREAQAQAEAALEEAGAPPLTMPERGPEITETH